MARKKSKTTQVMAFLALFGIIIWVIWTWVLVLFSWWNEATEQTLTAEQYAELQQYINSLSGTTATWELDEETNTLNEETN